MDMGGMDHGSSTGAATPSATADASMGGMDHGMGGMGDRQCKISVSLPVFVFSCSHDVVC